MAFLAGLIPSVLSAVKTTGVLKGLPGVGVKKRRRRRARLTQSELLELTHIKNLLGRTAAAAALPFYMGRGR